MVIDLVTYLRGKRDKMILREDWDSATKYAHRVILHVSMVAYWGIKGIK